MIVDSHIHLYDPTRPQGVPWPDPKDQIYRTILPKDFYEVAAPAGVSHAIIVEASPWLDDNRWILDTIANEAAILGFVGNLDLGSKDFPMWIESFAANPHFRGIRARPIENQALMGEPHRTHLKLPASSDLSLDMLVGLEGLDDVASLARAVPDLRIIVDHLEPPAAWREGILRCAEHPRVFCKVSRITEAAANWPAPADPEFYRPTFEHLWKSFGSARLLWGSNWPVAERAGDYATTLSIVEAFLAEVDSAGREAILWATSKEAYRWAPTLLLYRIS